MEALQALLAVAKAWAQAHPAAAFACAAMASLLVVRELTKPKHKRGYGSGENNLWNRQIRIDRPVFEKKHHKLEHVWQYEGERRPRTGGEL